MPRVMCEPASRVSERAPPFEAAVQVWKEVPVRDVVESSWRVREITPPLLEEEQEVKLVLLKIVREVSVLRYPSKMLPSPEDLEIWVKVHPLSERLPVPAESVLSVMSE